MGRWTRCLSFIWAIGLVNVWKLNISKEYFWIPCATFSAERGGGVPWGERLAPTGYCRREEPGRYKNAKHQQQQQQQGQQQHIIP